VSNTVNELQHSLLISMRDVLNRFDDDGLELNVLVSTLRGLYETAEFQDAKVRMEFESAWVTVDYENELRTETWAQSNSSAPGSLASAIAEMRHWVDVRLN
jgi:hypothetical protein